MRHATWSCVVLCLLSLCGSACASLQVRRSVSRFEYNMPDGYEVKSDESNHVILSRIPGQWISRVELILLDIPVVLRDVTPETRAMELLQQSRDNTKMAKGISVRQDSSAAILWLSSRREVPVGKTIIRSCAKDRSLVCLCVGVWYNPSDNFDPAATAAEMELENACASMTPR